MAVTTPTALDRHAADLTTVLAAIAADPHGQTAQTVRDDLRRAHERGVDRNRHAVAQLVRALPVDYRVGLLSPHCRNAGTYRRILGV